MARSFQIYCSKMIGLSHQHGRRSIVLGQQYGCRGVMRNHSVIRANTELTIVINRQSEVVKLTFTMLGPVHTNPFSNENGAVLLRFQEYLRPHLPFSYRFARPYHNAVSILKTLLYPQCACSNKLDACAIQ